MKSLIAAIVLLLLAGCTGVPDMRACLVSLDGQCLYRDFGTGVTPTSYTGRICP